MKKRADVLFSILAVILLIGSMVMVGFDNEQEADVGNFYTLTEAYESGWLTKNDLQSIAYYFQGSTYEGVEIKPKNPEVLSKKTETKIKKAYLRDVKKNEYTNAQLSDVHIVKYYGTYGDCVAVYVRDKIRIIDVLVIPEMDVGGVLFYQMTIPGLMIWKE